MVKQVMTVMIVQYDQENDTVAKETCSPESLFSTLVNDEMAKEISDKIANDPDADGADPISAPETSFLQLQKAKNSIVNLTGSSDEEHFSKFRDSIPDLSYGSGRKPLALALMIDLSFSNKKPSFGL
ncbi:hypothetical protein BDZ94DRAFT_1311642 [Collybia nuda]|uniref:Uncharacterized protein n=1 Tax=Collybia nuda TaxID=64659 RepID=A0A9P6CC57_9AGAR|nr:hypothetical protein BDZ94DRAFT_1311642 [Collybia nuda]